ncbi:unnamed protein product [Vicia faba]|uniref:Uncharacterized protein n=1 Tax=Vicia faba TaxID=3906 RepID=A0AAV1ATZ1_VICFA|nr:unnamed protein product [Vicia faba]
MQEGAKILASTLRDKAMEESSETRAPEVVVRVEKAVEAVNSGFILVHITDYVLDSSYPLFVTHIPNSYQSPIHSSKHTPSPKFNMFQPLEIVMYSPKSTSTSSSNSDESDFIPIKVTPLQAIPL